jgi:hypothetical protein
MKTRPSNRTNDVEQADEFFIGWLKTPDNYVSRLRTVAVVVLLLTPLLAGVLAASQATPGTGEWDSINAVTLEGIAYCRPYAMLRTLDVTRDGTLRTVLLVSEGKFGAVERLQAFDGRQVRVRGTFLHRDGRWMLELASEPNAITARPDLDAEVSTPLEWPESTIATTVTLRGEIIDPKCFLGAMKPGSRKTHKACATLCISGGIPPMLYAYDTQGEPEYYLLVTADGRAINQAILPFVGDLVELEGELNATDDLKVLRIDTNQVRRL